jgi:tetratricopeptide (TPR) repeat protein
MTRRSISHSRRFHSLLGLLTIGFVSVTRNGFAQAAVPADAPTSDTAPGGADAPNKDAVREAGEHYGRGLSLYSEGDYALAVIEFDRAYTLVSDYRVLYNVGQVRIQLGNYAKARVALERFLKEGGDKVSPDRLHSVEADLKMIAARTATLRIETNVEGATITVDDEAVGTSPLADPLLLDAGDHRIGVRKAGFNPADARYTLAGGDTSSTRLDLTAETRSAGPRIIVEKQYLERSDRTTWLWATWSATGVFAASGITLGALGLKSANDLDELRKSDTATRSQLDSTQRRARTLLTAGDILGGAAIVTGGVALYLTLTNNGQSEKSSTGAAQPTRPHVAVALAPNWIGLNGSY